MRWLLVAVVLCCVSPALTVVHAEEEPKEEPAKKEPVKPPADEDKEGRQKELLELGSKAPEVTATTWLNTENGESPIPVDMEKKLLLVEFWGTWCGPCVRSMPKIQAVWERYKHMGLIVVAVTREGASDVRSWIKERGYTMPVACDPSQDCISQFKVSSWPTTYLIGSDGTILYAGAPYSVEPAIEKAFGLPTSPSSMLTHYLDTCVDEDEDARKKALDLLLKRAPDAFDLRAWAVTILGDKPSAPEKPKTLQGKKALANVCKVWSKEASDKRTAALLEIARYAPEDFDLRTWTKTTYVKAFPLKSKELDALLAENRFRQVLDALIDRNASGSIVKRAGKHEKFALWCDKNASERWTFARKAVMALTYWMSGRAPPKEMDHREFSRDLGTSSWMEHTDPETGRVSIVGIGIGGAMVQKTEMPRYIVMQLSRSILMNAIANGHSAKTKTLDVQARKEEAKILASLHRKYGEPGPEVR